MGWIGLEVMAGFDTMQICMMYTQHANTDSHTYPRPPQMPNMDSTCKNWSTTILEPSLRSNNFIIIEEPVYLVKC